jgi:hypothetical protein
MKIKNCFLLMSLCITGLFLSCSKEQANQVIDQVSDYYVKCDADTGSGVFKFDVNTPIGKFEKNTKSILLTAQSLNNLNLTISIFTNKDTLSQATTGSYPLDSVLSPSSLTWGLTQTSVMATNTGNKIVIEKFEEKENGKRVVQGTFAGNIGSNNAIKLTNGKFRVLVNP